MSMNVAADDRGPARNREDLIEQVAEALADDWNPHRDPILTAMFRDYAATATDAVLSAVADERTA